MNGWPLEYIRSLDRVDYDVLRDLYLKSRPAGEDVIDTSEMGADAIHDVLGDDGPVFGEPLP